MNYVGNQKVYLDSSISPWGYKPNKGNRINTDIVNANDFKETASSDLLTKSPITSYLSPDWSYAHIASNEMETSDVLTQNQVSKTLLPDVFNELEMALPFDEVPGPKILKLAAQLFSYVPLLGTHVTTAAMMYFINMLGKYCGILTPNCFLLFKCSSIIIYLFVGFYKNNTGKQLNLWNLNTFKIIILN